MIMLTNTIRISRTRRKVLKQFLKRMANHKANHQKDYQLYAEPPPPPPPSYATPTPSYSAPSYAGPSSYYSPPSHGNHQSGYDFHGAVNGSAVALLGFLFLLSQAQVIFFIFPIIGNGAGAGQYTTGTKTHHPNDNCPLNKMMHGMSSLMWNTMLTFSRFLTLIL